MTASDADFLTRLIADFPFPPATREEWEEKARESLKGRDPENLVRHTLEGIAIAPVYAVDAVTPLPRMPRPRPLVKGRGWAVMQRIDHPDIAAARTQAGTERRMGADGLVLVRAESPFSLGFGLTEEGFEALLAEWDVDRTPLRLDAGAAGFAAAHAALDRIEAVHADLGLVRALLNVDCFGPAALAGQRPKTADLVRNVSALVERMAGQPIAGCLFVADTRAFHAAGCGEAQELALALAMTVELLRLAERGGLAPARMLPLISWLLITDADQFLTMAKLRAARLLHARLSEVLDVPFRPLLLQAESAWRMLTRRDPWVNLLRITSAAFAAGTAGADAITLLPFTAALGLADEFARRMARNAQIIALEEAGLDRVQDPAGGSAWVETATRALAEKAWAFFTEIESHGGLLAGLDAGVIQKRIGEIAEKRAQAVARRDMPITGVSTYPLLDERMPEVLQKGSGALHIDAASFGEWPGEEADEGRFTPLVPRRLAEPFEALRDAADAAFAETGERPRIYIAQIGRIAAHGARSTWARNLLAAGGIASAEGPAEDYAPAISPLVVLTGNDDDYAEQAPALARLLTERGADAVFIVARPPLDAAWQEAGIVQALHEGMDVLAFLNDVHRRLNIPVPDADAGRKVRA